MLEFFYENELAHMYEVWLLNNETARAESVLEGVGKRIGNECSVG